MVVRGDFQSSLLGVTGMLKEKEKRGLLQIVSLVKDLK
jgi:hypothetical protein